MIKKAFYIFLFFISLYSHAQSFEVKFSEVEKTGFRELHDRIIGYNETGFDILRYKFSAFGEATIFADHFDMNSGMKNYTIEIFKKDLYKNNSIKHKIEFEDVFFGG